MGPVLPALAIAAAGTLAFLNREKIAQVFASAEQKAALRRAAGETQALTPGTVTTLEKGRKYAVLVELVGGGSRTPPPAADAVTQQSAFLANFFGAAGFTGVSTPTLRDQTAVDKFSTGLPSTWVFTGTWDRPEKFIAQGDPAIATALFTLLPSS
jgi:hypothetical protein